MTAPRDELRDRFDDLLSPAVRGYDSVDYMALLDKLVALVHPPDQQPVAWRWRVEIHDGQSVTRWTLTDEEPKLEAPEGTRIEVQALTHPVTVTPAMIERIQHVLNSCIPQTGPLPPQLAERLARAALEPDA